MQPSLPPPVLAALAAAPLLGASGSRSVVPPAAAAAVAAVAALSVPVCVGCARGVDAAFVSALGGPAGPRVRFFAAASFPGPWVARLVARSVACVAACVAGGGVWVSFPSGPCPPRVVPGPRWVSGGGSGSWASLALAAGLGCRCLVWLPAGVSLPWAGWVALGGGWWSFGPAGPAE